MEILKHLQYKTELEMETLNIHEHFKNGFQFLVNNKDRFEDVDKNKIDELEMGLNLLGLNPIKE